MNDIGVTVKGGAGSDTLNVTLSGHSETEKTVGSVTTITFDDGHTLKVSGVETIKFTP